ncbi:MAG: SH3 domain-containing protein [Propioniciclava sp.]
MSALTHRLRQIATLTLAGILTTGLLATVDAPQAEAATTTRYTTTLNVRTGPSTRYRVVDSLRKGTRVRLNGRMSGRWAQLDNRRWVHSAYLSTSRPSTLSRCRRAANAAAAKVGLSKLPTITCTQALPAGLPSNAVAATSFVYGSLANTKVYISKRGYQTWSYSKLKAVFAHEFGHVLYTSAATSEREAAARAIHTTTSQMFAGSYANQKGERFAQAAAVCNGLTSSWGVYRPMGCSYYRKAAAALR